MMFLSTVDKPLIRDISLGEMTSTGVIRILFLGVLGILAVTVAIYR